ncbi:MAG: HAD family hydrolase [Sulfurimonas sp.]|nr:HAD family hydrolase [Sulfurimonas sp.]
MIILFDLDGTLIDSTDAIVGTFHHSFEVHDFVKPDDEDIKNLIGYPLHIMYKELGVSENEIWDYVATYKEEYRKISTIKTKLLSCATQAIQEASKFAKLGIVTTKTGKYSKILMEHFELMEYFDVLIGFEDVKNPKPHQEPILKALQSFKKNDEEIWMIGDTKLDIICANNAGVKSAAVLSGYGKKEELEVFTNIIFNDVLEVIHYLSEYKNYKI